MKREQFEALVKSPVSAGEEHLASIEKIIADYPYFQTAHLLYAKALHNTGHLNYQNALKRTAVIAGDRGMLYRLIQQRPEPKKATITEEVKPPQQVESKPVTNISITYDVVPVLKTEVQQLKTEAIPEKIVEPEVKKEIPFPKHEEKESLDEIVVKPVMEAYIETEILKITEKEEQEILPEAAERSFADWLKAVAKQTPMVEPARKAEAAIQPKIKTKTEKQLHLDKLLSEDLRISKPDANKDFFAASEKTRSSVIENEELVTETLAKIYVLQGNRSKAIRAYEILSLKYPEKSAYFAALITEVKNTIK